MAKNINKLPAITKAAELAAWQFAALEREAEAVNDKSEIEKRKRGIRIVSTKDGFEVLVQCETFWAQFQNGDFAIQLHE